MFRALQMGLVMVRIKKPLGLGHLNIMFRALQMGLVRFREETHRAGASNSKGEMCILSLCWTKSLTKLDMMELLLS